MTALSLSVDSGKLKVEIASMTKEDAISAFNLLKRGVFNMEESLADEVRAGVNDFHVITWEELGIKESDLEDMINKSKQKYAFYLLEHLKETCSKSCAQNDAKAIRKLIKEDFITGEELHATNDFLEELIAEAAAKEVLKKLEYLRHECPFYAINKVVEEIRKAVTKDHATSWGRMKIIESDLPEEAHQANIREFREKLEIVREARDRREAEDYANCLRKAVKKGLITWQELEVTHQQLSHLAKEADIRRIEKLYAGIDNNYWHTIDQDVDPIIDAVAKHVITWKRLGTTRKDFNILVHDLKVREYGELVKTERERQLKKEYSINYRYIRRIEERGELTFEEIGTSATEIAAWEDNAEK